MGIANWLSRILNGPRTGLIKTMQTDTTIENLVAWGAPQTIQTGQGPKILRKCNLGVGHPFWALWKANKLELKAAGVSVSQYNGQWQACWWQNPDPAVEAARRQEAEARRAAEVVAWKQASQGSIQLSPEHEARLQVIQHLLLGWQPPSTRQIIFGLTTYNGDLDASDTGTGKTYANMAAAIVLDRPLYVVCPKPIISSWKKVAEHFTSKLPPGFCKRFKLQVCNYELIRRGNQPELALVRKATGKKNQAGGDIMHEEFEWRLPQDTIIAFDECQKLCDWKTLNCKMGLAAWRQGYMTLGISATAAENPTQMKFIGLVTRLYGRERDFLSFAKSNGCKAGYWGGLEFVGGRPALEDIHRRIFPLHGTRIRISELGDQFPETQIVAECYDLNGAGRDIQAVHDQMEAELDRLSERESKDTECILTILLRARQKAELLKVPALADMAQTSVEEGLSVAIFVNFNETLDALKILLKTNCVIRGGQNTKERQQCIDDFGSDKEPIILCNIQAGGIGVTGLHGSPTARMRLALICPTWSARTLKQVFGRVWRAKGAKSLQRIFFAADTVEVQVQRQCEDKIKNIDTLNDGDLRTAGEARAFDMLRGAGADVNDANAAVSRLSGEPPEEALTPLPAKTPPPVNVQSVKIAASTPPPVPDKTKPGKGPLVTPLPASTTPITKEQCPF